MTDEDIALATLGLDLPLKSIGLPAATGGRRLGEILAERVSLPPTRIAEIVAHATAHGSRFGDAAVALGAASANDVLTALSIQFQYACAEDQPQLASHELPLLSRPHSAQSEALRSLRSRVSRRLAHLGESRSAIAVLSPDPGDGKTFVVANLGVAFAQTGARTLVIDADMRGPRLHEIFELRQHHGLSGALIGRADAQVVQPVAAIPGLHLLACGATPPNPLELIERGAFRSLMHHLPRHFDVVLVDTPAVSYGADALAIADRCGASLVIGRRNVSSMASLKQLAAEIAEGSGQALGAVVNDF